MSGLTAKGVPRFTGDDATIVGMATQPTAMVLNKRRGMATKTSNQRAGFLARREMPLETMNIRPEWKP